MTTCRIMVDITVQVTVDMERTRGLSTKKMGITMVTTVIADTEMVGGMMVGGMMVVVGLEGMVDTADMVDMSDMEDTMIMVRSLHYLSIIMLRMFWQFCTN